MKTILVSALSLTTILASLPAQASQTFSIDVSDHAGSISKTSTSPGVLFVRSGRNSGYYLISPESNAIRTLGLQHAPYVEIGGNRVGQDSIAFRFGPDGKLEGFPMYINQLSPDSFYTERLMGFSSGYSTIKLVQELFDGQHLRVEKQGSDTLAYLDVPVFNSLIGS